MNTLDISSYPPNLLSDIEIIYGKALLQLIMESKKSTVRILSRCYKMHKKNSNGSKIKNHYLLP